MRILFSYKPLRLEGDMASYSSMGHAHEQVGVIAASRVVEWINIRCTA